MNKTIGTTIALLAATLAFATPAAADCQSVSETGTFACADVYSATDYNAFVYQDGVAFAAASSYEYSFFGSTYRGSDAHVSTAWGSPVGSNGVSYSTFCMAQGGECSFKDTSVYVFANGVGYQSFSLWEDSEGRTLCTSGDATGYHCAPTLP